MQNSLPSQGHVLLPPPACCNPSVAECPCSAPGAQTGARGQLWALNSIRQWLAMTLELLLCRNKCGAPFPVPAAGVERAVGVVKSKRTAPAAPRAEPRAALPGCFPQSDRVRKLQQPGARCSWCLGGLQLSASSPGAAEAVWCSRSVDNILSESSQRALSIAGSTSALAPLLPAAFGGSRCRREQMPPLLALNVGGQEHLAPAAFLLASCYEGREPSAHRGWGL